MIKGLKLRLYPNQTQKEQLIQLFGNNRFVWNTFLRMLIDRYQFQKAELEEYKQRKEQDSNLQKPAWLYQPSAYTLDQLLPCLKQEYPFLTASDSTALQQTVHNLKDAYNRFFDRTKLQFQHPRFKKRSYSQSYTGKVSSHTVYACAKRYMKLPKLGVIKSSKTGGLTNAMIKRYTVSQDSTGRYWVSLQVDVPQPKPFPKTGKAIGLDLGLTHLAILSNGMKIPTFHANRSENQARLWQQKYSRRRHRATVQTKADKSITVCNSKNVERARIQKSRYQLKIAHARLDYLHKITTKLVKDYDLIVVEDLKVKNMMKNHHLARAVANTSWSTFVQLLSYKCQWYGKEFRLVAPHHTSRLCHICEYDSGMKPLHVREWTCTHCHTHHDRDINAACNILNKGLDHIQATV